MATTSSKPHQAGNSGPAALENFKFKAVIDWVWVRITLSSPSQFRHVQERMKSTFGKLYIEAADDDCNAASLKFAFKVQDPAGPDQLMRELQSAVLPGDPPLTEDQVEFLGVELAIDAYHRGKDGNALAPAVLHLFVHHAQPPMGPPRITSPRHFRVPSTRGEILKALMKGRTLHGGPKDADHSSHFYVKTYDSINDEKYTLLPPAQWRARFENTWRNDATPFKTIAEWRHFKFESLAEKFAQVIPTATEGLSHLVQERKIQIGVSPDASKIRPSDRRKSAAFTRRDTITNDKIRQALRALTRSQCCQNSVKKDHSISLSSEGELKLELVSPKYLNTIAASSSPTSQQSSLTTASAGESSTIQAEPAMVTSREERLQSEQRTSQSFHSNKEPELQIEIIQPLLPELLELPELATLCSTSSRTECLQE